MLTSNISPQVPHHLGTNSHPGRSSWVCYRLSYMDASLDFHHHGSSQYRNVLILVCLWEVRSANRPTGPRWEEYHGRVSALQMTLPSPSRALWWKPKEELKDDELNHSWLTECSGGRGGCSRKLSSSTWELMGDTKRRVGSKGEWNQEVIVAYMPVIPAV